MEQELYHLIRNAKVGDKEAFTQLMRRYKGFVFKHAYGMLNNSTEAEDITQEVFVKVYYSFKNLKNEYAFTSWLTRIVSNLCYDQIQKKKKKRNIITEWLKVYLPSRQSSKESIGHKELELNIAEAMQKLSTKHREVIILRDMQGFSYDEIADILEIPVGTVKSRIYIARKNLKKELEK